MEKPTEIGTLFEYQIDPNDTDAIRELLRDEDVFFVRNGQLYNLGGATVGIMCHFAIYTPDFPNQVNQPGRLLKVLAPKLDDSLAMPVFEDGKSIFDVWDELHFVNFL